MIAVPVALQSMLQASFSIIDQLMIGQLGSASIAGVGLAGKFISIFTVMVSAIGIVAAIMMSQYMGQNNGREIKRSFFLNLWIGIVLAGIFSMLCLGFPERVMGFYTNDRHTLNIASEYLRIIAGTFLPITGATLLSALLRCLERTVFPLIASIVAALLNTGLNYLLIPLFGVKGAAIATLISQAVNFLIILVLVLRVRHDLENYAAEERVAVKFQWRQYLQMLIPVLLGDFMWSLGENVYAGIYGHLGTEECAAMTLLNPIQGLVIGALCGLSQAASVIVGKMLGKAEYEEAYKASKKLLCYGAAGALILSVVVVLTRSFYIELYQVEETVKELTKQILIMYAIIAPVKVLNMIMCDGIIRSGGKTKYDLMIGLIGTWGFGVPLGIVAAFVLKLSIPYVYIILSLEECVRLGISIFVFKRKCWMQSLK